MMLEPPAILGPQSMSESQVTIRVAIKTVPGRRAIVARAYRHEVKDALERSQIPISSPSSMMIIESDGKVLSMTGAGGNGSGPDRGSASSGSASSDGAGSGAGSEEGSDDGPHFLSG